MICYRTHLLSPVQRARQCHQRSLLQSLFLTSKNSEMILEIIKFGFSEAFQIPSYPYQKIPFILTIPTVFSLSSYLLWGMRKGSCRFLCLHALSQHPLDVSGRMVCRQKGNFKGNPTQLESWETVEWGRSYSKDKFDEQEPQGGMMSGGPNRPSGGPGGDVQLHTTFPDTLEKGGPGFILEFTK